MTELAALLFVIFFILKLSGVIAWEWLWILSPLWIWALYQVAVWGMGKIRSGDK